MTKKTVKVGWLDFLQLSDEVVIIITDYFWLVKNITVAYYTELPTKLFMKTVKLRKTCKFLIVTQEIGIEIVW